MTPACTGLFQYSESYWIDGKLIRQKNLKILSEYPLETKMHIYYTQLKISILLQYVAISFTVDVCILHFMSFAEVFIAPLILPYSVFFFTLSLNHFFFLFHTCGLILSIQLRMCAQQALHSHANINKDDCCLLPNL